MPVLGVITREIPDLAGPFKDQQVVDNLVHKVPVVRNHQYTTFEVLQVVFQDIQRQDIEVVGGLVQNQEVGIAHQNRAEVKPSLFPSTEFMDVIMLCFRRKQEMLEKLRGRQLLAIAQADFLGHVPDHIDDFHLLVESQACLAVIGKGHGFTDVETPAVGLFLAH